MTPPRRAVRARRSPETSEREKLFQQLSHISRLASLGSLSSGIAHEVNNPLVAVKGFAQLIEMDESVSPEVRDRAREIIKAAMRIQRVSEHLRTYAKEMQRDEWSPVDINDTIEQSMILLNQQLTYRRIQIVQKLDKSVSKVWGIRNNLERVFHNLLTNSRDALSKKADDRAIIIETAMDGPEWIKIAYSDNGEGIPDEIREKVFEPFFTTKDGKSAAGLGLAIVKEIIDDHEGTLALDTYAGAGTSIVIRLKAHQGNEKAKPTAKKRLELVAPEKKWRLLVVDDEPAAAELLSAYGKEDFDSDVCSDPKEALKKIDKNQYDLIVTDLNMPDITGLDLLKHVKGKGVLTPVIIMSGYGDSDHEVNEAMAHGAAAFLQKPFEGPVAVREFLRTWVESASALTRFGKR